jgi:hypothetical protein
MREVLVEDISYEKLGTKVKKPLEDIKKAGYVGCQTVPIRDRRGVLREPGLPRQTGRHPGRGVHPGLREEHGKSVLSDFRNRT